MNINKTNLHQQLMDKVYNKWNTEECRGMNRLEIIEKYFTPVHKLAIQMGNFNYQINNGGFSQWHFNGYDEDLEDLIKYSKIGIQIGLKTFEPLLKILIDVEALGEPDDYNNIEHHDCFECGGSGEIEEYNTDTKEYEMVECPECYGDGELREEINGEEVYCELLEEFDDKFYEINEDEFLADCEKLIQNYDKIKGVDITNIKTKSSIKPKCKLIGEDGNVFNIIGKVYYTLKDANRKDEAEQFKTKAFKSKSYDAVLQLCMEYVNVY